MYDNTLGHAHSPNLQAYVLVAFSQKLKLQIVGESDVDLHEEFLHAGPVDIPSCLSANIIAILDPCR